jgi:hypothetical protein
LRDFNFTCDDIVDQGFAEFFEFFDLSIDGLNNLVNLGGFGVEVVSDRLLP